MTPEEIIKSLLNGTNPVTGERLNEASPWRHATTVRALADVLLLPVIRSNETLSASPFIRDQTASRKKATASGNHASSFSSNGLPSPDTEALRVLIQEGNNLRICAACKNRVSKQHIALIGSEKMFVFCDSQCREKAIRSIAYFCGWIRIFESSAEDEKSSCSACSDVIDRQDPHHLNFIVTEKPNIEVSVLCGVCMNQFEYRWERRELVPRLS